MMAATRTTAAAAAAYPAAEAPSPLPLDQEMAPATTLAIGDPNVETRPLDASAASKGRKVYSLYPAIRAPVI